MSKKTTLMSNTSILATVKVRITDRSGMPVFTKEARAARKYAVQKIMAERQRNFLVSYLRDADINYGKGDPYGVVVITKEDTGNGKELMVGWSRQSNADRKDGYLFEKHFGVLSALSRAKPINQTDFQNVPEDVFLAINQAISRALRYYKI